MPKFRRYQYFVDKKFQLKFVGLILGFMVLVAFFSALTIYYNIWMVLGEKLASVYPQGRLQAILQHATYVLLVRIALISPIVAVCAVFVSHRIAGPILRIKRDLESVVAGNYSVRLRLRRTDELKDVAEAMNKVLDVLESKCKKTE
ncbi:MAG: HAMP domain-containing protein [Candidatus Omnitrophica bacterium]|nr:HAMP domain-containing protein [Candidatus Omnitrophota bacterium]